MSKFFSLNAQDFIKGAIIAFGSAVLTGLYQLVNSGVFPTTWAQLQPVLITGVAALITYLGKNLFTNSQGSIGTEPPK